MELLVILLLILGLIIFAIGGIRFLIASFRVSIWWGLGCLFFFPAQVLFLIVHWGVAAKPFGTQIVGIGLLLTGSYIDAMAGM